MTESRLRIGVLLPEVLGTYGDTGNAHVLRVRAEQRGYQVEVVPISLQDAVPESLDLYTMGGGEDVAQLLAVQKLRDDLGFQRAVESNRPILAICAALQVLGNWYIDALGNTVTGLGVLDVTTEPGKTRAIGELATQSVLPELTELLTGFENHGGRTHLGKDAKPLGRVLQGVGNGGTNAFQIADEELGEHTGQLWASDGVVQGGIIATYLHGPVLARNPQLADLLLARALGVELSELPPVDMPYIAQLRAQRLQAVGL